MYVQDKDFKGVNINVCTCTSNFDHALYIQLYIQVLHIYMYMMKRLRNILENREKPAATRD